MTDLAHHRTPRHVALAASAIMAALVSIGTSAPALSAPLHPTNIVREHVNQTSDFIQVRAVVRRGVKLVPRKEQLTIRGDRDVLDWYKKQGARLPNPHQCFAPRLYAGTSEEKHLTLVCTGAVTKMASAATGSASRYALGWHKWK